jgi:DNA-binding transcriptional MerR regulator
MRISELCRRTGHTKDTIRFYEKTGLLPIERQGRGFKVYTEWHVIRLLQIKYAKAAGFTLGQIGDELTGWVSGALSDQEKQLILAEQLKKIDTAIRELRVVRTYLHQKMTTIHEAALAPADVATD